MKAGWAGAPLCRIIADSSNAFTSHAKAFHGTQDLTEGKANILAAPKALSSEVQVVLETDVTEF